MKEYRKVLFTTHDYPKPGYFHKWIYSANSGLYGIIEDVSGNISLVESVYITFKTKPEEQNV